jgi:hypothetical protein
MIRRSLFGSIGEELLPLSVSRGAPFAGSKLPKSGTLLAYVSDERLPFLEHGQEQPVSMAPRGGTGLKYTLNHGARKPKTGHDSCNLLATGSWSMPDPVT